MNKTLSKVLVVYFFVTWVVPFVLFGANYLAYTHSDSLIDGVCPISANEWTKPHIDTIEHRGCPLFVSKIQEMQSTTLKTSVFLLVVSSSSFVFILVLNFYSKKHEKNI